MLLTAIMIIQLLATAIAGVYFYRQLHAQAQAQPSRARSQYSKEMERLTELRRTRLTRPLSEQARPAALEDVLGQADGIRALEAILCSPNPQHVIIYGPPGVGKTCAARLVLERAKSTPGSPFKADAPFIEMDATCVRFDERSIADPLIGSVHDPIYQGAGLLGQSGIPQPKEGAVTRAHGGILFLDEIGELQPAQMNKLLKVLEDRIVRFESAYYNPNDTSVPRHIREVFEHGLPADFRLVGATTRSPDELPPALRSRCMEVFFRALSADEMGRIALGAAEKINFALLPSDARLIGSYCESGRDAVNIVQLAGSLALMEGRASISRADVEWVFDSCHYCPRGETCCPGDGEWRVGVVNGLAVRGFSGSLLDIEAVALPGNGRIIVSGIVDEEELGAGSSHVLRRRSTIRSAADNIQTILRLMSLDISRTDIHINFPGGAPVDGPSAGVAMAAAAYSAFTGYPLDSLAAVTGEVTVRGEVRPVGGIPSKIEAAREARLRRVLIPATNYQERFADLSDIDVIPVSTLGEAITLLLQRPHIENAV